jgi:hypothetical protein
MKKYKTVKIKAQEFVSMICDKCGSEYFGQDILELQEFLHINFTGGYASVFGDGIHVECDICQHCLKEMIDNFCIKENIDF